MTTTQIPHSLDAVIEAVQALIDGRPVPTEWQVEKAPEPAPPTPAVIFDEALLMQGLSELVERKLQPVADAVQQLGSALIEANDRQFKDREDAAALAGRVSSLEQSVAAPLLPVAPAVPQELSDAVLLVLDSQKTQTTTNVDLESRVRALEQILAGVSAAVHKDDAT